MRNQKVDEPHWLIYYKIKVNGCVNSLVTDILQNIFFCVQQEKDTHTGLEQLENE